MKKCIFVMKLIVICWILMLMQLSAATYGQKITLHTKNASLKEILDKIQKQTRYDFMYNADQIRSLEPISIHVKDAELTEVLDACLRGQGFEYVLDNKVVVIRKKEKEYHGPMLSQEQQTIEGTVVNEEGKPIAGVTIRLKSNKKTLITTNEIGHFTLPRTTDKAVVLISYLGYQTQELTVDVDRKNWTIQLLPVETSIEDVIVTGITERKRESFTGATASFTREELKIVNNQNIIQSLRALDPSFIQIENNAMGSNPNVLPTIELRGQTSISIDALRDEFSTDPNQPLFILDGFETNLRTIVDLDMNIVESVTILKDAASTAIYGSRASNGVVVIETIKPKADKVRLSYTTDLNMQVPDLTSYNMMNAREKLEFERLSGRYIAQNNITTVQLELDDLYARRLAEVERGVDTYWLSQPLQTGYSHRHSLSARGGQGAILFDGGLNYKDTEGLMIGNGRKDFGANLHLSYRAGKVNISNRAYLNGYQSEESPYGDFSDYVNTNPYYRLLDQSEQYLSYGERELQFGYITEVANPLYNAALPSYDRAKSFTIANNLQVNVDFSNALRLRLGGQISRNLTDNTAFLSPLHTSFDNTANNEKGTYNNRSVNQFSYTANAMLTYAKVFVEKHTLTANLRTEFNENNNVAHQYAAVGFPAAANGNPSFSFGYPEGGKPTSASRVTRRNSFLLSANYSFDRRYNVDVSFNTDGSTVFGSNKRYSPYYSGGVSWNLHQEQWMQDFVWLNMLRLRANIGVTGNQNFGNVSQSVYNYDSQINRFGQGVYLSALGAPNLEWQRTRQTSVGLDASVLQNRINFQLNAYEKYTDPLVVAVTLPSSTGLNNYPFNAGALNVRGVETILNVSPIYRPKDRVILTFGITGTMIDQQYSKFDNKLNSLNTELRESNALTRYRDGYSPRDIWAVRSLGIDPATGREVFLRSDGQQTFYYSSDDIVVVGNQQPLAEGVLRTSMTYKGFFANVMVRYIWNRDNLNTALFNKVENISIKSVEKNNQDRRALYDRWKQTGDISQFKAISITSTTPISSRFVQQENTFSGESINFGYEFREKSWLDKAQLSTLRLNGYMNDIFYTSTVKRERGTSFPFARSISMSLVATFK